MSKESNQPPQKKLHGDHPSRQSPESTLQKSTTTHIYEKKGNPISNYFKWRKDYFTGLTTGQKIRHRILQVLVVLSICVIAVSFTINRWIALPEIPITQPSVSAPSVNLDVTEPAIDPETGEFLLEGAEYPLVSQSGRREGVYTFLVIGQDTVGGGTDTMILVTYDTINKTIDGMSLLRDTMVNINATVPKLNAVYTYFRGTDKDTQAQKGTDALKLQVSRLTGIVPDFYIMIEWEAVGELVDAIGGVEFEVPYDMIYDDPFQDLHIYQPAGLRLLDGDDAMQVIRHRQNNNGWNVGDVGRVEVQQDFLIAVAETCLTPKMLQKATTLAEIFFSRVTTDLTIGNLLAFAQQAMGIDLENDIRMVSMPYCNMNRWNGVSFVGVIRDDMLAIVNDGFNPYLDDIRSTDLQLMYSNYDGSFGVTNAAMANGSMAYAYNNTSYTTTPDPVEKEEDTTTEGTDSTIPSQPDPVLPDPDTGESGLTDSSGSTTTPDTSDSTTTPDSSDSTTTPDSSDSTTTPDASDSTTTPDSSDSTTTPDSSDSTTTPDTSDSTTTPDTSDTTPPDSSSSSNDVVVTPSTGIPGVAPVG